MSAMGHTPGVRKWWPETDTRHPARVKGHGREAHCVGYLGQREKQEMRPSLQFPWFTEKLIYFPPWRSYVIVGCLRTNTMSDNEAYRICRTQGFYFTHQEPFHSDGWVPTFSLTQKTLNDVPLTMSHPQIKMIAQRVHFYTKQTSFKLSSQSHALSMGICKVFSSLMWDILCCWSWTETQLFINIRRKCEWPSSLVRAHCPLRDEAASGLSKNRGHFLQKVNKNIPSVLGYKLHFQLWLICYKYRN